MEPRTRVVARTLAASAVALALLAAGAVLIREEPPPSPDARALAHHAPAADADSPTARTAPGQTGAADGHGAREADGLLEGLVVGDAGEPVEGAEIRVVEDGEAPRWDALAIERDPPPVVARSDARGRFEAARPLGDASIVAFRPDLGWAAARVGDAPLRLVLPRREATAIDVVEYFELVERAIPGVRLRLRKLPVRVPPSGWAQPLETDPAELAIGRVLRAEAHTDSAGRARFSPLPAGHYEIDAAAPDGRAGRFTKRVEPGSTRKIALGRQVRATGRVLAKETGAGLAAEVALVFGDSVERRLAAARAAEADGAFEIAGPYGGLSGLRLLVTHRGFANAVVPLTRLFTEASITVDVTLDAPARLEGLVRTRSDEPIPNAIVRASSAEDLALAIASTSADGRFVIDALPHGGVITLHAVAEGFLGAWRDVATRGALASPLTLSRLPAIRLTLSNLPERADPPQRVLVSVCSEAHAGASYTAEQMFSLDVPQPWTLPVDATGRQRIVVEVPGRAGSFDRIVDLAAETIVDVAIALGQGVTVVGRLVATDGTPLPDAEISWLTPRGALGELGLSNRFPGVADAAGRFAIEDVPAGTIELAAHSMDVRMRSATVEVPATPTFDLGDFVLALPCCIWGSVEGATAGRELEVGIHGDGGELLGVAPIESTGTYRIRIFPGTFDLALRAADAPTVRLAGERVTVGLEEVREVVFRIGSASLHGRVRGAAAKQDGGAWVVSLLEPESATRIARCDLRADETFELQGLPAGRARLRLARFEGSRSVVVERAVELFAGRNEIDLDVPDTELRVRVRDSGGRALSATGVLLRSRASPVVHPSYAGKTDERGEATIAGLDAGEHEIALQREGSELRVRATVTLRVGVRREVELTLPGESILLCRVRDVSSRPLELADATVECVDGVLGGPARARAMGGGVLRVVQLGAGKHRVVATAPDHFPAQRIVDLAAERALEVDFALHRTGALRLRVLDDAGVPVGGLPLTITARSVDGASDDWLARRWIAPSPADLATDADGRLDVPSLPATQLTISADGCAPLVVDLAAGETLERVMLRRP